MSTYSKDCRACKAEKDVLEADRDAAEALSLTIQEERNQLEVQIIKVRQILANEDLWNYHEPEVRQKLRDVVK